MCLLGIVTSSVVAKSSDEQVTVVPDLVRQLSEGYSNLVRKCTEFSGGPL